jgi:hypothetical protein
LSSVKPSVIFFPFSVFVPSIMFSPERFLFNKCFIEIMLKIFLGKLDSELMHKSCARCFPDNIIVEVMLKKSSKKFYKNGYTCKLYVMKSYTKKYLLKI